MNEQKATKLTWKTITNVKDAQEIVDIGAMLRWQDMRRLLKQFNEEQQVAIVRHFARRLAERADMRLSAEILVESTMIWLANAESETLLAAFLEELLGQPGCEHACRILVEIALTAEISENLHDGAIFAMSVALICELGVGIQDYEREFPGQFEGAQAVLDHVATYLLSVSNSNNSCIRLSLLHYFGVTEQGLINKNYFNRIMSRFGHTVLDHLFILLFRKRSEAVALQYLLENLPNVLEADQHCQKIVHETFKFYMLKQPERFSLFVQACAEHLMGEAYAEFETPRRVFAQHIAALLQVVSEVNHKSLGRELIIGLSKLTGDPECAKLVRQLTQEPQIRATFREILTQVQAQTKSGNVQPIDSVAALRSSKRGRKPSFARSGKMGTIHQVTYLGQIDIQKAS